MSEFLEGNFIELFLRAEEDQQDFIKYVLDQQGFNIEEVIENIEWLSQTLIDLMKEGQLYYENVSQEPKFRIINNQGVETAIQSEEFYLPYSPVFIEPEPNEEEIEFTI